MRASLVVIAIAACNGNGQTRSDGRIDSPIDSYLIPATIEVIGQVTDPATSSPQAAVAGATVTILVFPDATPAAIATSDSTGHFTASVATNHHALSLHVIASAPSHVDTHQYATAVGGDIVFALDMLTTTEYAAAYATAGVAQTSGTGMIELDAFGYYMAGAQFAVTPSGAVTYVRAGTLDPQATATDDSGRAFVLNAPATTVTVAPQWTGGTTGDRAVAVTAGALTIATIDSPFGGD